MKVFRLITITIFLAPYCFGQNLPNDSLFKNFLKEVEYEQKYYKRIIYEDETLLAQYAFMAVCSDDELIMLTNHENPFIRISMFKELASKPDVTDSLLKNILETHTNDTAVIVMKAGCIALRYTVFEHMESDYNNCARRSINYSEMIRDLMKSRIDFFPTVYRGKIKKADLLKVSGLVNDSVPFTVLSFEWYIQRKNKLDNPNDEFEENKCGSRYFSNELIREIATLKPGDKLQFENIFCETSRCQIRRLMRISLIISE